MVRYLQLLKSVIIIACKHGCLQEKIEDGGERRGQISKQALFEDILCIYFCYK